MAMEKEHDVKQELLNAAMELFYEKGYDATSVNAIIQKVGVSKGAFYHYFKSKEEVLEAVVEQYIEKEIEITHRVAKDYSLNAIEKITQLINEVLGYKALNIKKRLKISSVLQDEGNIKFQRKVVENKFKKLHLPYKAIIQQGIEEGVFHPFYLEETVEQIMHMIVILNSAVTRLASVIEENPDNDKIIKQKIEAYGDSIERILGVLKGSINLSEVIKLFEKHL